MPQRAVQLFRHRHHAFIPTTPPSHFFHSRSQPIPLTPNQHRRHLVTPNRHLGRRGSGRVVASAAVDLKFIRENADAVRRNVVDRAVSADVDLVVRLYDDYVAAATRADALRSARNANAALMKGAGKMQPEERASCISEGKKMKAELAEVEGELVVLERSLGEEAARIPNMSHPDSPRGAEENARVLEVVGEKRDFAADGVSPVLSHLDLAMRHDLVDFETAARISGNKFYFLRNEGAMLELALINWAMAEARARGFTILTTPDVVREDVVAGCGFQPRGESSQVYRVEESDLCLVGTSEIALGGYYSQQIVAKEQLPIKMAAFSHCFRREVGAAGSTTRGLYRVHQFSKVELFVLAHPDESDAALDELRAMEVDMYSKLGLHFKVLDMPTQDLGNPAYRKFDIEAWMPGREAYGEVSSASNCTDYQARRLGIRYREQQGDNRYVHTLNATACAVPRMIIAILETHQRKDGSVRIPDPLVPFMGGLTEIRSRSVDFADVPTAASGTTEPEAVKSS